MHCQDTSKFDPNIQGRSVPKHVISLTWIGCICPVTTQCSVFIKTVLLFTIFVLHVSTCLRDSLMFTSNGTVHFWQTILYTDILMILAIVMNYLQTFSHSCSYFAVSQCQNKTDRYKDTLKVPLLVYEPFPKIHSYCHWTGQIEKHKACMCFSQTTWIICCFIDC
jgi:hypothetical protein